MVTCDGMTWTRRILLAVLLLSAFDNNSLAQSSGKHSLHFEFYQPLHISAMGEFYNEDWYFDLFPNAMPPDVDFERNYYSSAFGLRYDLVLPKNFILKSRVGISFRKLKETYFQDYHNYQDGGSDDYIYDQKFTYFQLHTNAFIGISKRIILNKRFFIDVGPQLAFVHYMQSESKSVSHTEDYGGTSSPVMIHDIAIGIKHSNVDLIGVGSKAELCMKLTDRITTTLGFQAYCFLMRSNGTRVTDYHRVSQDIPNATTDDFTTQWRLHQKIRQSGFSNVSPVVSVGYNF